MPEQQEPKSSTPPTLAPDTQELGPIKDSPMDSPMQPIQTTPPDTLSSPDAPQRIPYWLQQAERFLRVLVRIYLGLLVCFAPWYPPAWDANPLFSQSPWLMGLITQGAVRGIVSGLGLLNLWIALRDLLRPPADPGPR
jgi:hypothetical protein